MPKSLSLALYLATKARQPTPVSAQDVDIKEKNRALEKAGEGTEPRPQGPLIWFHTGADAPAASPTELARRMLSERGDLNFLLTTTADARRPVEPHLHAQFCPDDTVPAVRKFLDHWRPEVAIWTEPDLRPALITEVNQRSIPLFLIDTRTARPDTSAWRWWRGMSGALLSKFERILTGDQATASTLRKMGAQAEIIEVTGYLEEGTPALPCNEAERDLLAQDLSARPVWLAAHVKDAECAAVIEAHQQAQRRAHRLLLILVPDRISNGPAWAKTMRQAGLTTAVRSEGEEPGPETQVYVADTEEEMGLWYRLAPISFLGRSLSPDGGINPFEAAALGSAIIHGTNVRNHRPAFDRLAAAGATRAVRNAKELGDMVERLLSPDMAASMAHAAWQVCSSGAEVTDRVRDLIFATLDEADAA